MATAAAVWVDVLPSMKGFGAALSKEVSGAADTASTDMSRKLNRGAANAGTSAGKSVSQRLGGAFDSTFSRAERMAANTGNGISRNVGRALTGTMGPLGRFRDGFTSANAAASAFSGTAGTMGGRARRAFDGIASGVEGVRGKLQLASTQAQSMLAPMAGIARTAGLTAVATAIGAIGFSGARAALQLDQSEAALTGLYGSGEMAVGMMQRLRGLASKSPIEYTAFVRGAESLAYMGYSGDTAHTVLQRINTALVSSGKGAAAMDQVNYAMLEMVNTGKVYAAQLTQMSQAGLPVWSMLADYMGMSIAEVREQVTKGAVEIDTVMAAIQAGGGETFKKMEAAAEQSAKTLSSTWAIVRDNVTLAAADMIRPFTGGASTALSAAGGAVTSAFQAVPGVLRAVGQFLSPLVEGFRAAGSVLGAILLPPLKVVGGFLAGTFGSAIQAVTGFLGEHKIVLYALGAVLGVIATSLAITQGAMLAYQGIMLGVRIATGAWAAAQWVLNAAMLNNPLGYVLIAITALVAGVIYAWQNFDWFREIVTGAWNGIVAAAQWAWSGLQSVWSWLGSAVTTVGGFFTWLWTSAVVPAFNGVVAAIQGAWTGYIKPVLDAIWFGLRLLGAVIFTVFVTPYVLAWQAISAAGRWAWDNAISPILGWISTKLGELGVWFGTVQRDYISPAWHGVGAAVSGVYHQLILPTWNLLKAALAGVGAFFGWIYSAVIKPAWDAVGNGIRVVYLSVIAPTWNLLKIALGLVGSFFQWVWSAVIKPAWNALGVGIRTTYHALILPTWNALRIALGAVGSFFQWVYSAVIKPAWDAVGNAIRWVYDTVVRPAFDAVKTAVHSVGQAFQNVSTWIRDAWAKVREYAAAPVRFVVNTVYNSGIRPVWNWIQDKFGLDMALPEHHFAGGGVLGGYAPGRDTIPAMLSPGEAVLTPEAVRAVGPSTILALNAAASGRPPASGAGGSVHAAGGWLSSVWDTATSVAGGVWGGIKDVASAMGKLMTDPLGWIKDQLSPFTEGLAQFGGSPWVRGITEIPTRFIDAAVEKVKAAFTSPEGGAYGMIPVGAAGAGVQRWAPLVLQALAMMGQPASYLGITLRRMNQESGGNPNIGNYWDINAKRGTPSMGLMQVIGPTFAAYRDPRAPNNVLDPLANILASMRYALSRYGSLPAAYNKPGGYRNGGWLMPGELAYNETRRPEPILSSEQWDDLQRLSRRGTGAGSTITVNAKTDATPDHIAAAIDRRIALRARL